MSVFPHPSQSPPPATFPESLLPSYSPGHHHCHRDQNETLTTLRAWIKNIPPPCPEQIISDIDFRSSDEICQILLTEGIKLRFHWFGPEKLAIFRMGRESPIHELPATWLTRNDDVITQRLNEVAPCGHLSVCAKGSSRITLDGHGLDWGTKTPGSFQKFLMNALKLANDPSNFQPDCSLHLQYSPDHTRAVVHNVGDIPRVVLETGYSQSEVSLCNRAVRFLHDSRGLNIHAVILCDMTYLGKPGTSFRARISVWIRHPTGQFAEDYPIEKCRLDPKMKSTHHRSFPSPNPAPDAETSSLLSAQLSQLSQLSNDPNVYYHPDDKKHSFPIWNRSGWKVHITLTEAEMVIYDEEEEKGKGREGQPQMVAPPEQADDYLELNFYDFARPCDYNPIKFFLPPDQQVIRLELAWLRKQLIAELPVIRGVVKAESSQWMELNYPRSRLSDHVKRAVNKGFAFFKSRPSPMPPP
ncbi:hypothetical protein FRC11_012857 [Ceratobasidium sp. 423]|nr:hypothetical protein FRC11_012857 [Ceratobasidium sp. 423]